MILSKKVLRAVCVMVGALIMIQAGHAFIFSVYTNAIKKKFHYTQSQVEIMSSFGSIGAVFAFPAGYLAEFCGPRAVALLALAMGLTGYLLLWSTTEMVSFYAVNVGLQYVYIFVAYFSSITSYMAALIPNVANFHPKYRGTIVGVLDACFSAGTVIYIAVYGSYFVNGHVADEENQDIGSAFIMLAITCAVANVLGITFLGYYKVEGSTDEKNKEEYVDLENEEDGDGSLLISCDPDDVTGFKLIKRWDFQFLFWGYFLASAEVALFLNNVSVYLKSFSMEEHSTFFNIMVPVCGTFSKFSCGVLSDRILHLVQRPSLLLFFYTLHAVSLTLCIFLGDDFYVLLFSTITTGLAFGAVWSLTAVIIGEYYGMKYYGRNWGFCLFSNGIGVMALQQVFGFLYESEIRTEGDLFCYGLHCFRLSFAMIAVISICSVVMTVGLIQKRKQMSRT